MFDGRRRWALLGVLAAGNLALWVGIAYVVGLCAGDELDLGLETLARHAQATVVASLEEITAGDLPRITVEHSPSPPRTWNQAGEAGVLLARATAGVAPEESPAAEVSALTTAGPSNLDDPSGVDVPAGMDVPSPMDASSDMGVSANLDGTATVSVLLPAAGESPEPGAERAQAGPTTAGTAKATPGIAAEVVSAPLLLVDPEFHTLAALNAELERSAPGRVVQIRYQEEALNREIATLWINNPSLPYRDVQVDLQDNGVAISGQVTVLGFQVDAHLEGTVVARNCQPQLEVENVSLAGIMAPRFVRARVVTMAQESMAWYPADYPLCLEQIVLEETRATFYGYHR